MRCIIPRTLLIVLSRSPLILKATWATNTVKEDVIGVFIETDKSHPEMKLIFEALFLHLLSMAVSFQLKLSSSALGVNREPNPAINIIMKVFTRNFNKTNFHWFLWKSLQYFSMTDEGNKQGVIESVIGSKNNTIRKSVCSHVTFIGWCATVNVSTYTHWHNIWALLKYVDLILPWVWPIYNLFCRKGTEAQDKLNDLVWSRSVWGQNFRILPHSLTPCHQGVCKLE